MDTQGAGQSLVSVSGIEAEFLGVGARLLARENTALGFHHALVKVAGVAHIPNSEHTDCHQARHSRTTSANPLQQTEVRLT